MKILFATVLSYWPSFDGASRMNRTLAEGLAERGHSVDVVSFRNGQGRPRGLSRSRFLEKARSESGKISSGQEADIFKLNGVRVHSVGKLGSLLAYVEALGRKLKPDRIVVSLEDPSMQLLQSMLDLAPKRVVALALTTYSLPFGPDFGFAGLQKVVEPLRQTPAIVTPSNFVRDYIYRWAKLKAKTVYMPAYGPGPFPTLDTFKDGLVTLINPCGQKGAPILESLATKMPDVSFGAVPTWGADPDLISRLKARPNITILRPAENIEHLLKHVKVLLAPSLFHEAFGLVVVESMLRGIPVVASNAGGLPEAKLGTDMVVPVRTIERYLGLDEKHRPIPKVPRQNLRHWIQHVRRLTSDRSYYQTQSSAARAAALKHVRETTIAPFERIVLNPTKP